MGICNNCKNDVYLKHGEVFCDACGLLTSYMCWNCNYEIVVAKINPIYGEEKECAWCSFFVCPDCGKCGRTKNKFNELEECVRNKTRTQLSHDKMHGIPITSSSIIQIMGNNVTGKVRKYCVRNIPFTHAKKSIKQYYCLIRGFTAKNDEDKRAFRRKYEKITEEEINNEWIVKDKKGLGEFGQEIRFASHLSVCLGYCEYKKGKWKRVNGERCEYFNTKNLMKEDGNISNVSSCKLASSEFKLKGD